MSDPIFGVVIRKGDQEALPAVVADLDTIGIVGPADNADPIMFPLDEPVKLYSNDTVKLAKLGEAGFMADAVRGINDQLAVLQRAGQIVIVRTARGVNANPALAEQLTMAKIMGSSTAGTGIFALLKAPELTGAIPRINLAPGYTGQLATGANALQVTTDGAGYEPGTVIPLVFSGGGPNAVQATGHALVAHDGTIGDDDVFIDTPGAFYTSAPTVAIEAPPAGDGVVTAVITATTDTLANPVCVAFPSVLNQLVAHAVVESAGISEAGDRAWREGLSNDRLIGVTGGVKVTDVTTGATVVRPFAPRVAGAMVATDFENGNTPFNSAANRPIQGIVGPGRTIPFVLNDGANEGQSLLAANIGILVRGEVANDFAIASGGFVFVGTDNLGEDETWRFYNQMRGRDFINLMIVRTTRYYLGRSNITAHTIQSILNTLDGILSRMASRGYLIGYALPRFLGAMNSADAIRAGAITVAFKAEEPAPLRKLTVVHSRYRDAVTNMVVALESNLGLAA
jgi:phage tail sheath protein FI